MAILSCELTDPGIPTAQPPSSIRIDRLESLSELAPGDLQRMTSFWNASIADRNIRERFEKHSSLWLLKVNGSLAGYGWTMDGTTMEPYFFPFAPEDIHLFDFHVFPEYRGRGLNPLLVRYILSSLASERKQGKGRALIEAAEWNTAQLYSLRNTPFRQVAWARKSLIRHRPVVSWLQ